MFSLNALVLNELNQRPAGRSCQALDSSHANRVYYVASGMGTAEGKEDGSDAASEVDA
jgi:hypothetical protein